MSVLIKGMQIPENCIKCGLMCALRHFNILNDNRPSNCPLVELPEHHGRLIDANVLATESLKDGAYGYVSTKQIYDAETIIEAE